ncbi:MAG: mevalonate kinase [Chloroflexi bacterium]|nr:mevalonate kinase [Chloroflexota bacterium]
MHPARAHAPGKIILFGEHAVVHGQPAIAVPLAAVQARVEAIPDNLGSGLTVRAPDVDRTLHVESEFDALADETDPLYNALLFPLQVGLDALNAPVPDLAITVRSSIPIASGLGSGAALATALIRALALALGRPLSEEALNALVYEVEKRHHGNPSGIDNTVIVYERPVYFVRGTPPTPFTIGAPFTLVVADTGVNSPTRLTVADVGRLLEEAPERITPIFERIGAIACDARAAIEAGQVSALGPLMTENHTLLDKLTVSSPELNDLCAAARAAGALGAKLSGGGRGGNMIALVTPERAPAIARALQEAGATSVFITTVS